MNVMIKGFEMPESCDACRFYDDNYDYPTCIATGHSCGYNWSPFNQRMPDCPLVPVQPHGRLIDADALYRRIKTECNPYGNPTIGFEDGNKVLDMIDIAPTVIETEDGE